VLRVTEVKSLHQRLDEKQTRIEMLESRVETSATKSTQSEAENSKLHSQVKMYADATKSLQRDLEQLERENEQLKKASKTRPSKTVKRVISIVAYEITLGEWFVVIVRAIVFAYGSPHAKSRVVSSVDFVRLK